MGAVIRKANSDDAPQWLELLKISLGEEYPDPQVYQLPWIVSQLDSSENGETWVAELEGKLQSSLTFLPSPPENQTPILNLGRHLIRPEALQNEAGQALLNKVTELAAERSQTLVSRVLASNNAQQILYEQAGYTCVGFQPFKHVTRVREGALFYVRFAQNQTPVRLPISDSLPQIQELIRAVIDRLQWPHPQSLRDGAVGYPLQSELKFHDAIFDDFQLWRIQAQSANPPVEISGLYNHGLGYLRMSSEETPRAILAQKENQVVGGLAYNIDSIDRCFRIIQAFSQDDLAMGALLNQAVRIAQEQFNAVYVELDVLVNAPRLLKSAEQLGFVPIAYLPAFYCHQGTFVDVVKMVKLNMVYSPENGPFTSHAKEIVEIIGNNFHDQKMGVAIINLLRALPIFEGLGDGELRKLARLFNQKLYRPGERIFNKGDSGNEAYVVMRGQINIMLEENLPPIATIGNGQIFGELAFLDGAARVALAEATQPSILLVIKRSEFTHLIQNEPHLGMVVLRNIAIELSNRLRKTNQALTGSRK